MATLDEVVKVMVYLSAHFPKFELTETTLDAYHDVLKDLPADLLQSAARAHAAAGKYFPFASELRRIAFEIQAQAQGIPSPGEAWADVMREMRRVGSWGRPEFANELVTRAVDAMGGWSMLCASDNQVADRAHFLKLYGSFLERYELDSAMLPEIREMITELSARLDMPQLGEGDG